MSRTGGASYCDYGYDILRHPRTALSGRSITSFSPRRLFPSDGQPFHNPIREGLPTNRELVRPHNTSEFIKPYPVQVGSLLPLAFLLALLRRNVGLYNFSVFREICYPVELAPSKR